MVYKNVDLTSESVCAWLVVAKKDTKSRGHIPQGRPLLLPRPNLARTLFCPRGLGCEVWEEWVGEF